LSNLQLKVPTLWIRRRKRMMISLSTAAAILFPILIIIHTIPPDLQILDYALAQNSPTQNATYQNYPIPTTISNEAQEELRNTTIDPSILKVPDPDDLNGWKKQYLDSEFMFMALSQSIIDLYQPNISEIMLDGVQVLDIKPRNWTDNGKVLVYTHGGAYTFGSAISTLGSPVLTSNATGLRIMSINYTVAPFSKWNQTTDQIVSVIQMLKEQLGYSLDDIAVYGDSAGGGLISGSILKMRDRGLGLPAALVLWSPWLDLTGNGDTYITLKQADQYLSYDSFLRNAAGAYADHADQKNPYVSPVYGNFTRGYSPTLIQGGTREIFLSDFIRLYQALDQADIPVKLDIYEGMPHVHQILYKTPESKIALSKMNEFLKAHLDY
jgi:epsilon-lactone hydrolase